jgi:hypothetical protein
MKILHGPRRYVSILSFLFALLSGEAANALGGGEDAVLAPYGVSGAFDMFTISGDMSALSPFPLILNSWNKGILSADVPGFSFVLSRDDASVASFDFLVKAGLVTIRSDWNVLDSWGPCTEGGYISHDATDPPLSWFGALLRTTRNAPGLENAVEIPLRVFVSADAQQTIGTLNLLDLFGGGAGACSTACCGLRFSLNDCAARDYADVVGQSLRVWFDVPDRAGVYCCQDLRFAYVPDQWTPAFMGFPLTVARLNDAADIVRVRVAPNSHIFWLTQLLDSMVDPESPCDLPDFSDVVVRPWKKDYNSCPQYTGTSSDQMGLLLDRYLWRTSLFGSLTSLDLFASWDLTEIADIRFGEALDLGVWYGGFELLGPDSCDCGANPCGMPETYFVPRVLVQNLGVRKLDVSGCCGDLTAHGICGTDCGLCDTLPYLFVDAVDRPEIPDIGGRGIYGSTPLLFLGLPMGSYTIDAAYRYGDFWRWNGKGVGDPEAGDIITLNCGSAVYPAFTKTIQPMANSDFVFAAQDGTTVRGRWNTNYFAFALRLVSNDCSPDCSVLFVHAPCDCEAPAIVAGLRAVLPDLSGDISVISDDLDVGRAEFIRNPDPSDFPGIAALRAAEGDALVWYDAFSVEGVDPAGGRGILPVQLRFTIPAGKLAGYDFSGDWRKLFWSAFTLRSRPISGNASDITSDLGGRAKPLLDRQSFVAADADEIRSGGRIPVDHLTVWMTVFVVDGPSPGGRTFKNATLSTGNDVLFVFDGKADSRIENILYIARVEPIPTPSVAPTPWTLAIERCPTDAVVVGRSFALTAVRRPVAGDVLWGVETFSPPEGNRVLRDVVTLSGVTGNSVSVTAVSPGRAIVTARAGGLVARCDIIVAEPSPSPTKGPSATPTTSPASGGGGCSAGTGAFFAFLFVLPAAALRKR